jgi:hypothetical protein
VTRWDDPRVAALNPGRRLPGARRARRPPRRGERHHVRAHRLPVGVSAAWAAGPGRGKDVRWPTGVGRARHRGRRRHRRAHARGDRLPRGDLGAARRAARRARAQSRGRTSSRAWRASPPPRRR